VADKLATEADLAAKLQVAVADLDAASAAFALEAATAVVQATVRQRLVLVTDDTAVVPGSYDNWLRLPERPVVSVASVSLDGTALSLGTASGTYRLRGGQLWRDLGWLAAVCEPSDVTVVYSHGYGINDQGLQLARGFTATLAAGSYESLGGAVQREQIDDYSVAYAAAAGQMETTPAMSTALRRQYGRKAGMVWAG
jgi:hypothetical protein